MVAGPPIELTQIQSFHVVSGCADVQIRDPGLLCQSLVLGYVFFQNKVCPMRKPNRGCPPSLSPSPNILLVTLEDISRSRYRQCSDRATTGKTLVTLLAFRSSNKPHGFQIKEERGRTHNERHFLPN